MKTRRAKLLKAIREATAVTVNIAGDCDIAITITKAVARQLIISEDNDAKECEHYAGLADWSIIRWDDGEIKLYHSVGIAQDEAQWIEEGSTSAALVDLI